MEVLGHVEGILIDVETVIAKDHFNHVLLAVRTYVLPVAIAEVMFVKVGIPMAQK